MAFSVALDNCSETVNEIEDYWKSIDIWLIKKQSIYRIN